MLPCVGCVGVVLGGRCWHSPFPLAMACCDSRPGFCCLKSPSVVSLPSFRHPPLGHKLSGRTGVVHLVHSGRVQDRSAIRADRRAHKAGWGSPCFDGK